MKFKWCWGLNFIVKQLKLNDTQVILLSDKAKFKAFELNV